MTLNRKDSYENGMTSTGVPLVSWRPCRHVEVCPTKNDTQNFVTCTPGFDDVITQRPKRFLQLVILIHTDDDSLRILDRLRIGGNWRIVTIGWSNYAPMNTTLPTERKL